MKKSAEVLGLPIVSIMEGKELGTVKHFVINPHEGKIVAFVIDDGKWHLGAKLLSFDSIIGLGENAVIVEHDNKVMPLSTKPEYEKLLEADIKVIGSRVLTKSGKIQGNITEIVFDHLGKINNCEMTTITGEQTKLPAENVLTLENELSLQSNVNHISSPILNTAAQIRDELHVVTDKLPRPVNFVWQKDTHLHEVAKIPEDTNRKIVGKKANRRIETDNGVFIVEQGGEITEEVLQKAKLARKFVELSMNI